MKTQPKKAKRRTRVVRDWNAMPLETVADVRLILAFVLRKVLLRELDVSLGKAAADIARAILKTHELERALPSDALAGLARILAAAGAEVVSHPGQGVEPSRGDEVQNIESEIRDSTCGAAELQDGDRQTSGDREGMAK